MKIIFLLSLLVLSSIIICQSEEAPFELEIQNYNNAQLQKIALACEKFSREKENMGHLLGGLDDYIFRLSDNEIIEIIKKYSIAYPELRNVEKLNRLANIEVIVSRGESWGVNYLNTFSRSQLEAMALASETYYRKKENKEGLKGGLHDYIASLSKEQVIEYIMNKANSYPELQEIGTLEKLAMTKFLSEDEIDNLYFDGKSLENLCKVAIKLEKYDREISSIKLLGGIHDYCLRLSSEEVIAFSKIIMRKWPSLYLEGELFKVLPTECETDYKLLGLESHLSEMDLYDLKKLALVAEKYDLEQKGTKRFGGLHDYIFKLDKLQIVKIIKGYLEEYPTLNENGKLEELANIPKGGFRKSLENRSNDQLKAACIAVEKYHREVNHLRLRGGIGDYVHILSKIELVDYIVNNSSSYDKIREANGIDWVLSKYNF